MTKSAKAFAPAAISSFFEIHDPNKGKTFSNLVRIGARGGGFGLEKGVETKVTIQESKGQSIDVFINSKIALEAKTTRTVVQNLMNMAGLRSGVIVEHKIEVPIGSGFGTSAGGAITAGLALKEALDLPLTCNQIGKIAHFAEIECNTGLGTVSSLTCCGGCVLVVEPGAPGVCRIDSIPISPNHMVVCGFVNSKVSKEPILSSLEKKTQINKYGKQTMKAILANPTLKNFLDSCWVFSQNVGFATEITCKLVESAKEAGAVGAAQNMIGEAVHALVLEENAPAVAEAFKRVLPSQQVIVSRIDFQGARLTK